MASTDAEQVAVATEAGASAPAPAAAPAAAPAPDVDTESLVQGLVREWLVKNGHKDVLRVYDAERVRILAAAVQCGCGTVSPPAWRR